MANIVAITVRATDDTSAGYAKVKAEAAKAGAAAADAFNSAFKMRADATVTTRDKLQSEGSGPRGGTVRTTDRLESTGGIAGDDKSLLNRLKGYANTPGGIGILGTGNDSSLLSMLKSQIRSMGTTGGPGLFGTGGSGMSSQDIVRQVMTGNGPGNVTTSDVIKQVLSGNSPGNVTTQDMIKQVLTGNTPGNVSTEDLVKQVLEGTGPSDVTTKDFIKQIVEGNKPGNFSTTDLIKEVVDPASSGEVSKALSDMFSGGGGGGSMMSREGESMGQDLTDGVHSGMEDRKSSFASWASDIGGKLINSFKDIWDIHSPAGATVPLGQSLMDGVKQGLSNGLAGVKSFMSSSMNDLAKMGSGASGLLKGSSEDGGDESKIAGALNSGGIAGGALPGIAGLSGMQATIVGIGGALVAVLPALTAVAGGVAGIGGGFMILESTNKKFAADMKSTMSGIQSVFAAAAAPLAKPLEQAASQIGSYFKQIGPLLKQVFGDSAPLIQPLVYGLEGLVGSLLPGFTAMIKAAGPVFQSFAGSLGDFGHDLGSMFQDFASDGAGSATILKSLMDLIGSLLPVIGDLGKIMVSALAPAFSSFSGAVQMVLPAIEPLFKILGSLAGAVLSDLAGVLGALGSLLTGLAPSFTLLAKVASSLFTTLENTGVFAILGNVLESLAGPISNLVNALVEGLAPALPQIIGLISQWSGILVTLVADGLTVLINAMVKVVQWLTPVIPLVTDVYVAFKAWGAIAPIVSALPGIFAAVTGAVTAMTAAMDFDTIALKAMYLWDGVVAVATKAWAVAQGILNAILDMNPFVAIGIAVVAIAVLIIKYHTQIWNFIVATWNNIFGFLKGVSSDITSAVSTAWDDIFNTAKSVWIDISDWLKSWWYVILLGIFTGGMGLIIGLVIKYWSDIESETKSIWGGIVSFFDGIPGKILGDITSLGSDIYNWAVSVMKGMLSGFESVWNDIIGFFKGLTGDILDALGIHSPPQWAIDAGTHIMNGIGIGMSNAQSAVQKAAATAAAAAKGTLLNPTGSGSTVQALMKSMAASLGWSGTEWTALNAVEMREAGYNLTATNPTSGAYGLAQFINGASEYAQYGGNANTAAGQITGMLNYIAQRYGNPEAAWNHEATFGWYDHGGWLPTGYSIAYNTTGRPEPVGAAAIGAGPTSVGVQLEVDSSGSTAFEQFMLQSLRHWVRVKGGGSVQKAFGYGPG